MPEVKFEFTNVFYQLMAAAKINRYLILYGGSSSSKTISILQWLTLYALKYPNKRITVSSESLPIIKKTIFPDWKLHVMGAIFDEKCMNKTEMVYTFPNGSVFNFIPADDDARWHGLRQDVCYFDELYYINRKIYDQADIRTADKLISSFNPVSPFWVQEVFDDLNTAVLHSTYKDNQFVSQPIKDALEKRIKTDQNFYNVYVLGKFGSYEGVIFQENKHWSITDEFPQDYSKRILAIDFGFSVDPATCVDVRYSNGEIWLDEVFYDKGMTNADIYEKLVHTGNHKEFIIGDSAEPKSIVELQLLGVDIDGSMKGKDSINAGIQLMQQFKINVTRDSIHLIKELRNYKWAEDRQGEQLTKPIDNFNDCIDASRYGVFHLFMEREGFTLN